MKALIFHSFFIALICLTYQTKAQQAKAYQIVKYKAQKNNLVFVLDYADGYLGASQIKMKKAHKKTQVFSAGDGVAATNGNFVFHPQDNADKCQLILLYIIESAEVPKVIHGSYHNKGTILNLIFHKSVK